jgi:hypothetical protein
VVIDDLRWAAPTLLDLRARHRLIRESPILLLTMGRPEFLDSRPAWAVASSMRRPSCSSR